MAGKSIFITKSPQKNKEEQQQGYNVDQETKQRGNRELENEAGSRARRQHKIANEDQMKSRLNSELELSNASHNQPLISKHPSINKHTSVAKNDSKTLPSA